MLNPFAPLADPDIAAAALAWHAARPPGRRHGLWAGKPDHDDTQEPIPAVGAHVTVTGGKWAGKVGWIMGRKNESSARIRSSCEARICVQARFIAPTPGPAMPPTRTRAPQPNRHGMPIGSRVEVIGGRHRGRMATLIKMSGGNQVRLRLDSGAEICPSARYVRVLADIVRAA